MLGQSALASLSISPDSGLLVVSAADHTPRHRSAAVWLGLLSCCLSRRTREMDFSLADSSHKKSIEQTTRGRTADDNCSLVWWKRGLWGVLYMRAKAASQVVAVGRGAVCERDGKNVGDPRKPANRFSVFSGVGSTPHD